MNAPLKSEAFEQRCPQSEDGRHCFHGDTQHSQVEVCCWCGKVQSAQQTRHGPYAPRVFEE